MKRLSIFFLYLFTLTVLISCKDISPRHEMLVCGSYSVPGMICYDLKGGKFDCEILEEDSHGRILYEYTTKNVITDKEETALVICQMFDSEYVYFYEDKCYLLSGYENSEIDKLKEQNDWNEALDQSKMSRREINISFDLVLMTDSKIEANSVRSACRKELGINDKQLQEFIENMRDSDILMITADHGCDPGFKGTDHSREYVPFLAYGKDIKAGVNLGTRATFADIAATIQDIFGVEQETAGVSFKEQILK